MDVNRILFPTDFSHCGDAALAFATALARDTKATLVIVHVEEPAVAYGGGEMYYGIPEPATADLKAMLKEVKPTVDSVPFEHHLITGDPAGAIVRFAETEAIDLIVLGTHGRTGLMRMLMGSVAESIVRRAPCPVLTFKQPEESKKNATV